MNAKFQIIVDAIKSQINTGKLHSGEKLPSELDLAEEYATTKATVRQALKILISEGYLHSISRVGCFIADARKKSFEWIFDDQNPAPPGAIQNDTQVNFLNSCEILPGFTPSLSGTTLYSVSDIPVCYVKHYFLNIQKSTSSAPMLYKIAKKQLKHDVIYMKVEKKICISGTLCSKTVAESLAMKPNSHVVLVEEFFTEKSSKRLIAYFAHYYRPHFFTLNAALA